MKSRFKEKADIISTDDNNSMKPTDINNTQNNDTPLLDVKKKENEVDKKSSLKEILIKNFSKQSLSFSKGPDSASSSPSNSLISDSPKSLTKSTSRNSTLRKLSSNLLFSTNSTPPTNQKLMENIKKLSKKLGDDELEAHLYELNNINSQFVESNKNSYEQYEQYRKLIGKIDECLIYLDIYKDDITIDENIIKDKIVKLKEVVDKRASKELLIVKQMHDNRKMLNPEIINYFENIEIGKIVQKVDGNPYNFANINNVTVKKIGEDFGNSNIFLIEHKDGNKAILRAKNFERVDAKSEKAIEAIAYEAREKLDKDTFPVLYASKSTIENGGYTLTEYLEGGNLKNIIENTKSSKLTPDVKQQILFNIYQVLNIMNNYLDNGFVYCDPKLGNFVANSSGILKTPDEKSIQEFPTDNVLTKDSLIGISTVNYLPPELEISGKVNVQKYLSYTCGLICYQIATRTIIEDNEDKKFDFNQEIFKDKDGTVLKQTLQSLLSKNPADRMSIRVAQDAIVNNTSVEIEDELIVMNSDQFKALQLLTYQDAYDKNDNNKNKFKR